MLFKAYISPKLLRNVHYQSIFMIVI